MGSPKARTARKRSITRRKVVGPAALPRTETAAPRVSHVVRPVTELSFLVVEADPDVQVQVARTIRTQGHRVVGTSSGTGALALVSECAVDLILVSQDLPGRAGVEVTRLLRQRRPTTPVLLMASSDDDGLRDAARAAGAEGCVTKPFTVEALARWLGARRQPLVSAAPTGAGVAELLHQRE